MKLDLHSLSQGALVINFTKALCNTMLFSTSVGINYGIYLRIKQARDFLFW